MLSDYGEVYRNRPLWGEWYIGDRLGEDCCGTVHAAIRGKESTPHSTVIKVCRFPSELFYRKAVTAFGNDAGKITRYFEDTLEGIIYKLHLSSSMACHGSIVNYHDYKIDRREKGPGRIVLFRKDQVIPLDRYAQEHPLTKGEAIRLGIELCEALSYHLKGGAAQGYLRMESIFVSQEGAFKLGDTFEKDLLEGQAPALPLFAAPEVLLKENFDHTADIYTLGLILYKLFNKGCLPFLPSPSGKLQRREIKRALARRGKKEPLPSPALAGEALSALILKACAGEPSLRFSTPPEMKLALEELASDLEDEALSQSLIPRAGAATEVHSSGRSANNTAPDPTIPEESENIPEEKAPDEPSSQPEDHQQIALDPVKTGPAEQQELTPDSVSSRAKPAVPPRTRSPNHVKYAIAACLFLLVAIAVLPASLYHHFASQSEPVAGDGNTAGNINNNGLAVLHDGYLYYTDPAEGSAIRRSLPDGDDISKLGSSQALYLNIVNDWIYYVNSESYSQVYKMRTDGSDNQQFISNSVSFIQVAGGLLYYANRSDFSCLYRVDPEGSKPIRLNEEPTAHANISGQWIYYLNKEDKHIYKMRLDGREKSRLNQHQSADILVAGGWIYYRNMSDHWRLYRMSTAGTGSDRLTRDPVYQFNVDSDGGIFFTNGSDGKTLYRLSIDEAARTTEQVKLNDDSTANLNIAGDWIYYINESEGGSLYRIRPDGTDRAAVR